MIAFDNATLTTYGIPLALLIISPFIGGLLIGIDRKLTARIQNRRGPPIVQPFYDVLKLFGKEDKSSTRHTWCSAWLTCSR